MITKYAVEHRTVVSFCVALIVVGGIWSYFAMGRLEDPEFTVRTSIVTTLYPGATASEVDQRVTDVVERHIRRVEGVKTTRAISRPGVSIIYVDMRDDFPPNKLPLAWQDLRNKMGDLKTLLPPEAIAPNVHDDFGDVFGIVLALRGDGFTDAELRDCAQQLQRELITIGQVGRVELWGVRQEVIEVSISRSRMAELSIHPAMLMLALSKQNLQMNAGQVTVHGQDIKLIPTGNFLSVEEIGELVIPNCRMALLLDQVAGVTSGGKHASYGAMLDVDNPNPIRLKDIATIRRTYDDPPRQIMRSNGHSAVGIAIAPIAGGDVIEMGEHVHQKLDEIMGRLPVGYSIDRVCYQPDNVVHAISVFEGNLRDAIIIVTVVVMIAMGLRSGIIITCSLLVVILATLCILYPMGVVLQRTSLGAFIVALGILVDDAVVVGDMILVNMQRGMNRKDACIEGAKHVGYQLLGATIVGALAFWPVYLSPDATGEYCRDLFIVVGISLGVSWFVAMIQTPVVYYDFIHVKSVDNGQMIKDPHSGPVFRAYRKALEMILHHKTLALLVMVGILFTAGYGFRHVRKIFFPPAQRAQFLVEYWRPSGTSIHAVSDDLAAMERSLAEMDGVTGVAAFVGSGAPRFYLPYEPETPCSCYGMLLVNVEKTGDVDRLIVPVETQLKENFPQGLLRARRFSLSPTTPSDIEVRLSGPDHKVLHDLSDQVKTVFRKQEKAKDITDNWREPILVWTPEYSQVKGMQSLVGRSDINMALRWATQGISTAVFMDQDDLIPVRLVESPEERDDFTNLENIPVWGLLLTQPVPLRQLLSESLFQWQPSQIHRRNGEATITVGCNPHDDTAWNELLAKLRGDIEKIEIPNGYKLEWGGQKEKSVEAETMLLGKVPIALIFIAIIVVSLFNSLRQPLIIMLSFPLMLIGITFGLLLTGFSFGFMALVGAMSLLGMSVRNGVVLMSQIDVELAKGDSPYQAVVNASVERMRPVTVAAMTVVVGMIPLLWDPLFNSMAAAIMFGLIFATVLTLFIVPTLYVILFRIKVESCDGEKK